jgi:hypothetical protein
MGAIAPAERPEQQVETDIGWEAQGAYEVLLQLPCSWAYVCKNHDFRTKNTRLISLGFLCTKEMCIRKA